MAASRSSASKGSVMRHLFQDQRLARHADDLASMLLEYSPVGLVLVKEDGEIVYYNPLLAEIFGYGREELRSINLDVLIPNKDRTEHRQHHRNYLKHPTSRQMGDGRELFGLKKDGSEIPLEIGLNPIRIEGHCYVLGSVIDISDRRELQSQKEHYRIEKDKSDAANLAKSAFLAHMTHEIRTPLTAIIGFTHLLQSRIHLSSEDELLASIVRNTEHLKALVDDILDFSRIEAGAIEPEEVAFPLATELEAVQSMLRIKAASKNLDLVVQYENAIPEIIISDPLRFRQVLVNLVGNAIKFTDSGYVRITVSFKKPEGEVAQLILRVSDTGCGISSSARKRLFKPFSQAGSFNARKSKGTGLGLALSRNLARLLGGDVVLIKSNEGEGSIFEFTMKPSLTTSVRFLSDYPKGVSRGKTPLFVVDRLAGYKILLAEDSVDIQTLYRHFLEHAGAQVDCVGDGLMAVEMALANSYDAILMDMQMPKMDGYEATCQLRGKHFRTPIIALTAGATKEEKNRCIKAGCSEFKTKPLSPQSLVDVVYKWSSKNLPSNIDEFLLRHNRETRH